MSRFWWNGAFALLLFAGSGWFDSSLAGTRLCAQSLSSENSTPAPAMSATVRTMLAKEPTTPYEWIHSANLLIDFGHDDLARQRLEQFQANHLKGLNDQELFQLYRELGADLIFRLSVRDSLAPIGAEVADAIVQGAQQHSTDPSRITQLISQVLTDNPYDQVRAVEDLRLLGEYGAAVMVNLLADEAYRDHWGRIRAVIRQFGRVAEKPLQAALRSDNGKLQAEAIRALRYVDSPDSTLALYAPCLGPQVPEIIQRTAIASFARLNSGREPNSDKAVQSLYYNALQLLLQRPAFRHDIDGELTPWWTWDARQRMLQVDWIDARVASSIRSYQWASDLVMLYPSQAEFSRLYWLTRLQSAKISTGVAQPLPAKIIDGLAAETSPDEMLRVLEDALRFELVPAATACCEILKSIGDASVLTAQSSSVSPLVEALDFGSLRLTHAAAETIFAYDPPSSFPGCSRYVDSLIHLSQSSGNRRVVIADTSQKDAQTMGSMLGQLQYQSVVATHSQELIERINSDPDIELVVLVDSLQQFYLAELVQNLRANKRSSQIPIALMVEDRNWDRAQRLASEYSGIHVTPYIEDVSMLARQIAHMMEMRIHDRAANRERAAFAATAMNQLVQLSEQDARYPFLDLHRYQSQLAANLYRPGLSTQACFLLGQIGSPDAQKNLLRVASSLQNDLDLRQIAADSFQQAVKSRGLMLTRSEILSQYDRYNASAAESEASQTILGYLLDIIENKVVN